MGLREGGYVVGGWLQGALVGLLNALEVMGTWNGLDKNLHSLGIQGKTHCAKI